jgi:hypothetical protein
MRTHTRTASTCVCVCVCVCVCTHAHSYIRSFILTYPYYMCSILSSCTRACVATKYRNYSARGSPKRSVAAVFPCAPFWSSRPPPSNRLWDAHHPICSIYYRYPPRFAHGRIFVSTELLLSRGRK